MINNRGRYYFTALNLLAEAREYTLSELINIYGPFIYFVFNEV